MSPFKSIKTVANELVPVLGSLAAMLLKDRFKNIELMKSINCAVLIVHGKADKLISYLHSKALQENLPK